MTREEILAMEPGRELEALVAEKVMGLRVVEVKEPNYLRIEFAKRGGIPKRERDKFELLTMLKADGKNIRPYSTDIAAAWGVREWLTDNIGGVEILNVCDELPEMCRVYNGKRYIEAQGKTAPEAISKAALLAVLSL